MELVVSLFRHDKTIFVKVLEQVKKRGMTVSRQGCKFFNNIRSSSCPQMSSPVLYVRGDDSGKDNMVVYQSFRTDKDADLAAREIMELVAAVNKTKNIEIECRPIFGNPYEAAILGTAPSEANEVYVYTYTAQTEG